MSQARFLAGASGRFLERSSTTRQLNLGQHLHLGAGLSSLNPNNGPSIFRCRSGFSTTSYHHVANSVLRTSFPYTRTLATNPPQTSSTPKTTEPPIPVLPSKKSKVELRPGPTKPATNVANAKPSTNLKATQSQGVESTSKTHPTKPPPLFAAVAKDTALKEIEGKGVIDVVKKDLDDAARHGILTPPPADAGFVGRLFHQAKELFKFYWAGLKYIFAHRKEVKKIGERIASGGAPITWREHRFIQMNRSDMIKLIPFLLTVIIIEEIIPLIVMYIPGMLPSTCVLPSQRARIVAKRHERQREAYASAKASSAFTDVPVGEVQLKSLTPAEVNLLCNTAGISPWGVLNMQRRRLVKHLREIAIEDTLLLAEGNGAKLTGEEISAALCDRGFLAESIAPPQQRDRLRWWLENIKSDASITQKSPVDVRAHLLITMLKEARI